MFSSENFAEAWRACDDHLVTITPSDAQRGAAGGAHFVAEGLPPDGHSTVARTKPLGQLSAMRMRFGPATFPLTTVFVRSLQMLSGAISLCACTSLMLAYATIASQIDPLFDKLTETTPGAMVLVARDGKVLFEKGYGAASLERHEPIRPDTRFRVGSISKEFTAASILKLQEQGKLHVADRLSRYFPDWPGGDDITLYHLLSHTSGIHNYTAKPEFAKNVTTGIALDALIESFRNDAADFPPGTKYLYGNSGYVLLASIVAKVSGEHYEDFLRKTFFDPLGMLDTGIFPSDGALPHAASGYAFEKGEIALAVQWHPDWLSGCGSLYSTARDLFRWNEALFSGRVLAEATIRQAFSVATLALDDPTHPEETGYGMGWIIDRLRGEREVSHGGDMAGFGSYLLRLPEKRLTVVVLLNCVPQQPGLHQWNLARDITVRTLASELPAAGAPSVDLSVPIASLEVITGRYDMGGGLFLVVSRRERHVYMEISGRPKTEIFPRTDRIFFVPGAGAEATFVRNANGEVVKAILKQAGARIDAPKIR